MYYFYLMFGVPNHWSFVGAAALSVITFVISICIKRSFDPRALRDSIIFSLAAFGLAALLMHLAILPYMRTLVEEDFARLRETKNEADRSCAIDYMNQYNNHIKNKVAYPRLLVDAIECDRTLIGAWIELIEHLDKTGNFKDACDLLQTASAWCEHGTAEYQALRLLDARMTGKDACHKVSHSSDL